MKKEDQVTSMPPSKELAELGLKQESVWYWTWAQWNEKVMWVLISEDEKVRVGKRKEYFSAPTVAELGEMLPSSFYSYYDKFDGWTCSSPWGFCDLSNPYGRESSSDTLWGPCAPARQRRYSEEAKTEADARAKMVIFLIKAGLIKAEEVGKK